jgi:DNA-directed RNA polymerase specialized sigma24 family protein
VISNAAKNANCAVEDQGQPREKSLPDLARSIMEQVLSSQEPYKVLNPKILKKIVNRFVDFLNEASHVQSPREVEDLVSLVVMALLRKHALNQLRNETRGWRLWICRSSEDKADQISDQLYGRILQQLPRFLSSCRERRLDHEHAYNSFSKYCRVAVKREITRLNRKEKNAPNLVPLTSDFGSDTRESTHCYLIAQQEFDDSDLSMAMESWLNSNGCPVSHDAWRKFSLKYKEGRSYKEIAKIFDTTVNAVTVSNSRVKAELRKAGFLKEVLDLELDRLLKTEFDGRSQEA